MVDNPATPVLHHRPPADLEAAIQRYIRHHITPGSFLRACLENDLLHAACRADSHERLLQLPTVMRWLYCQAPDDCWGSPAKVKAWLAKVEG